MKPVNEKKIRRMEDLRVPMRDGIHLATMAWLPPGNGPFPVVLIRTAYNRAACMDKHFPERGIAIVVQDCRGRYGSEGEFIPFLHEAEDGEDTLAWLGRQPWCNGKVGMCGPSYLAATQFAVAQRGRGLLRALAPGFMAGDCWKRAYYCDGAFSLALTWSWLCFECAERVSNADAMPQLDVAKLLRTLPILSLDERSGVGVARHYREYARRSRDDAHWEALRFRKELHGCEAPTLLTGGWYDYYPAETVANFAALRDGAPTKELRDGHRMILGPWSHGIQARSTLGEVDFGSEAPRENDVTLRWLETLLGGRTPRDFQEAPIRIFVMGINRWRDETEWPLARARPVNWYLRADRKLSREPPRGEEPPDRYDYDPNDPVPTLGGNHSIGSYNPGLYELAKPGPYDQRPVEARPDVLTWTSDILDEDTEVTGPVSLRLHASSSARDTDFVARLTDVHPDGRSINLTEGVIRARFRENVWGAPKLLEPGAVYEFTVDLQVTSNVFLRGHRIRLQVTSSNFPLWDRNLNTGNDPATDTEMTVAHQTLYHDAARPSHLVLPIVARPSR